MIPYTKDLWKNLMVEKNKQTNEKTVLTINVREN